MTDLTGVVFVLAVVAGISNSVMIRVLLVRVFYERTAVTLVSYSVTVTILLIRISSKRTVVLKKNEFFSLELLAMYKKLYCDHSTKKQ